MFCCVQNLEKGIVPTHSEAIVRRDDAPEFLRKWRESYVKASNDIGDGTLLANFHRSPLEKKELGLGRQKRLTKEDKVR